MEKIIVDSQWENIFTISKIMKGKNKIISIRKCAVKNLLSYKINIEFF